jgi:hypothetical protein
LVASIAMFAACGSRATTQTAPGSIGSSQPVEVMSSMPSVGSLSVNAAAHTSTTLETGASLDGGATGSVQSTSSISTIPIDQTSGQAASPTSVSPPTSLAPWPDATTTTTGVIITMAPSTTEQPRQSPIESSWNPAVVITPEDYDRTVAVSVGDTVALIAPTGDGADFIDRNYPQDSFGVDADLLRVVAFGGDCPATSICAAWAAVDAGVATIAPPFTSSTPSCGSSDDASATTYCEQPGVSTDQTISVEIGVGARAVTRIGSSDDGTSIAVPVGSIVDVHLDEVTSRIYKGGEPLTPEYWHAPSSTTSGVLVAIGQAAPVRCHNDALGLHDCLSLLAVAPGMTTLTFVSGYTCDFGGCGPQPTYATQTFTLTIAVTPR